VNGRLLPSPCCFHNPARLTRTAVVKNVGAKPMRLDAAQVHGRIQAEVIGADDGRIANMRSNGDEAIARVINLEIIVFI
jgi:hypothetical protein